jgi:hypothetical protein
MNEQHGTLSKRGLIGLLTIPTSCIRGAGANHPNVNSYRNLLLIVDFVGLMLGNGVAVLTRGSLASAGQRPFLDLPAIGVNQGECSRHVGGL